MNVSITQSVYELAMGIWNTDRFRKGHPLIYAFNVWFFGRIPRHIMVPYHDFVESAKLLYCLGLLDILVFIVLLIVLRCRRPFCWDNLICDP
jgi:hypothetical protein